MRVWIPPGPLPFKRFLHFAVIFSAFVIFRIKIIQADLKNDLSSKIKIVVSVSESNVIITSIL